MSYALTRLTGDGSTQTFTIGFAYRDKADIVVKVDGILKYLTSDYTFVTDSQIRFNTAPATDAAIVIRRATSQHNRLVDYVSGAVFRESDLDTDSTQGFFMAQESIDIANDSMVKNDSNLFDAENVRVVNVADPVGDKDAANKEYVQSALADQNQRYYGSSATAPSSPDVEEGDLYWDTTSKGMKVHNGTGWQDATAALSTASARTVYVVGTTSGAYGGSTHIFPTAYDAGFVDVFLNGAKLQEGTDFIATNGYNIELTSAATNGDIIDIISYGTQTLTNVEAIINNVSDINTVAPHVASIGTVAADLSGSNTIGSSLTNATNAASSASAAATSESNAATSEANAATSETNAATSETNAAASAASITGLTTATGAEGTSVSYNSTTGVLTVPKGDTGDGFTGGAYNSSTGQITFSSNDGIGFTTADIRTDSAVKLIRQPSGTTIAEVDAFGLDVDGSTRFTGSVAINGLRAPAYALDVEDDVSTVAALTCTTGQGHLQLNASGTTSGKVQGIAADADDLIFYTNSSESVRIQNNGRVGIGEAYPGYSLHVSGDTDDIIASFNSTDSGAYIRLADNASGTGALVGAVGEELSLLTGTTEKVRLKANGNFGINVLNPTEALDVDGNINASGSITASGYNSSNWDSAYNDKITAVNYTGSTLTLTQQDGGTLTTTINASGGGTATGVDLADNVKATFGDSDDLEIYHDGSHSYIDEVGTGNLYIRSNAVAFGKPDGTEFFGSLNSDGSCFFKYDNDTKLATTSTGIDVTGTVTADGLDVNSGTINKVATFTSTDGTAFIQVSDSNTTASAHGYGVNGNNLSLYANDTEKMRITADGNVGIGTTAPASRLHVNSGASDIAATLESSDSAVRLSFAESGSTGNNHISLESNEWYIYSNSTERLRIDSSGNVGIGTSSPVSIGGHTGVLTLHGDNATAIVLKDNVSRKDIRLDDGNLSVRNSVGDAHLMVTNGGNVGIGTTSPAYKLDVAGSARLASSGGNELIVEATTANASTLKLKNTANTYSVGITHNGAYNIYDVNAATERLRIDSSGNLLVGKTSPDGTVAGFEARSNGYLLATVDGSSCANFNRKTDDGTIVNLQKNGTTVGSIGTTSGNLYIEDDDAGLRFSSASDEVAPCGSGGANRDNAINLGASNNRFKDLYLSGSIHGDTVFKNNAGTTEYARFNSGGYLGIGDSVPIAKLHVQGTSQGSGCSITPSTTAFFDAQSSNFIGIGGGSTSTLGINFGDSADADSGRIYYRNSVDTMAFYTLANERMTIDQSGNVGVGTTTPLSRMHLKKYSTASGVAPNSGAALFLDDASSAVLQMGAAYYGTSSILFGKGASGSTSADNDIGSISYNNYYNYLAFRVNAGERMRVDSTGSLLVGQTTAGSYGAKVRVGGVTESTYYVSTGSGTRFLGSGYFGSAGINVEAYTDSSTTTVNLASFKSLSGVQKGSISLVANTVSYNTTSDERLKENIKDAEDAGDKIDAIQVRQFDWKDGGQHQDYGVIAQELDKVAPEAVTKGETEDDMMSVDYSKLVPTLIKEIQTLRNRVAELEKN